MSGGFGAARVRSVGTSIFTEMSALAQKHGAVNLGQGFPDFAGPPSIKAAATAAVLADHNQYAPTNGLGAVQQAVAAAYQRWHGHTLEPAAHVTVTSGATEALMCAVLALVEPGDEVVLLEPWYDAYPAQVRMAGGVPVFVRMEAPEWKLPVASVAAAITPRTRGILLNTPVNPVGRVFSAAELDALAALCVKHNLWCISDEVYDRLVFAPHVHTPMFTRQGMWERTITIHSTGKTFSLTGWKVGYAVAPAPLTDVFRRVHQFNTFCTATPLQHALLHGFALGAGYEAQLLQEYGARRDLLVNVLTDAGFRVAPPEGTYFVMADYRHLRDVDDVAFCRWLTAEVGVASIPPSAFFHDGAQCGQVRFCFAKKKETLEAAATRLKGLADRR